MIVYPTDILAGLILVVGLVSAFTGIYLLRYHNSLRAKLTIAAGIMAITGSALWFAITLETIAITRYTSIGLWFAAILILLVGKQYGRSGS